MLLINGVVALVGMIIAGAAYMLCTGLSMSHWVWWIVAGIALWVFLSVEDIIQDKLVEAFNRGRDSED